MKNINKSIRLDQKTFDYIIQYRGNGFNEKLQNIVDDHIGKEDSIKKRIEQLEELLDKRRMMLYELNRKMDNSRIEFDSMLVSANKIIDILA